MKSNGHDKDIYLDALRGWVQLMLVAVFACICAGVVYELAQPWVNAVIEGWRFAP